MTARVTEQPHEVLNRAADLLEQRASKATPGPWRTPPPDSVGEWIVYDADWAIAETRAYSHNDAEWTATMSPAVAAPLVALLRATAQYARALAVLRGPVEEDMHVEHALTFARMVLGEAS